jgi:hypothetical protein
MMAILLAVDDSYGGWGPVAAIVLVSLFAVFMYRQRRNKD